MDHIHTAHLHPTRLCIARVTALVVLVAVGLLGLVSPALAHEALTSSTPAQGATVDQPPPTVVLEFSASPNPAFVTTTVTAATGERVDAGAPLVTGPMVTIPVRDEIPAGTYTVGYRVTSNDGHPITGQVSYTVANAGVATHVPDAPTAAPSTPSTTPPPVPIAQEREGGTPVWPWFLGVIAVVVLGATLVVRRLGR